MKDEKETRQRLLACAKKEFMEKGYMSASLRSICKQAEVTTGALYFFFRDKADLFAALVEEPVNKLYEVMMSHYQEELYEDKWELLELTDSSKDTETALKIIHYMYQYYDEFHLVLTKSQGSGYETCMDRFIEITQKHYRILVDNLCRQWRLPLLDDYIVHWMAHMNIDAFVYMITHEKSEKEACQHMEQMVHYFVNGFIGMLKYQKEKGDSI